MTGTGTPDGLVLTIRGLRFRYAGRQEDVLQGISFDVARGEVVGILGPNGSGKSTLLSAVLDMRKGHRDGLVSIAPDLGGRGARTAVGYATQQTALYGELTCRENLLHAARLVLPRGAVREAVARCVDEFGLVSVVSRKVGELSGGWRRLVHIAASFVHDPPLRFLDEPTTALDFETRGQLVELVRGWSTRGVTSIVTSHYPEDLEEMCTRLVVIRHGRVVRTARLADLLTGLSRQLVIETTENGEKTSTRVRMPSAAGDLAGAVTQALTAVRIGPSARLETVGVAAASLRGLLTQDPQLAGVIEDE
ncbi:ABC transporter ATP-binding protein [Streptomyces sp. NPDC127079]|uniref:ABC transporter ATP-binding protein n=1 Tax=Streptomyces sp. NPDC127079 TaxID=3347132 RepID=UPI00364A8917